MGISLITGGNLLNKGAQSMVLIAVDEVKKRFPGDRVIVISDPDATGDPSVTEPYAFEFRDATCIYGRKYKLVQHRYGKLDRHHDAISLYKSADRVIDISGYTFGTNWGYLANILAAYRAARAAKRGIPIYYMAQSFGPFKFRGQMGSITRKLMQKWLSTAKVLYVREEDGLKQLRENFHLPNARLSVDLVLQNRGIDFENVYKEAYVDKVERSLLPENLPVVQDRSVAILPNDRNLRFGDKENVLKVYKRLVNTLLSQQRHVYLIYHAAEDLKSCQMIKEMFPTEDKVILVDKEFSCLAYGAFVKKFDYIIASRYHGVVHAYKEGVPCIVLGWAVKYTELLHKFEQLSYAMDVRSHPDPEVAEAVLLKMEANYALESEKIRVLLAELQRDNSFDILGADREISPVRGDVRRVPEEGLCTSCGVCAGVCPVHAISFGKENGGYVPVIDAKKCLHCGKCLRACPGIGYSYAVGQAAEGAQTPEKEQTAGKSRIQDRCRECLSVQTKDRALIKSSTSGGFITTAVRKLLQDGQYDVAFLAKGYNYEMQMKTMPVQGVDALEHTEKSRYIPVSQENAIRYILEHPQQKVIYVGTPCAVHGLCKALTDAKRGRDNLLVLGLFCDMSMNYSMYDYANHIYPGKDGAKIAALHFRDKRAGGYPGNMRIEYDDGSYLDISAKERMILKDFCRLERCLYCLDKLNGDADFSVGDNYTNRDAYQGGSCSLILRSQKAREIWDMIKEEFAYAPADFEEIAASQKMAKRVLQMHNIAAYAREHCGYKPEEGVPFDLVGVLGQLQGTEDASSVDMQKLRHLRQDISLGKAEDFDGISKAKRGKKRKLYIEGLKARLRL